MIGKKAEEIFEEKYGRLHEEVFASQLESFVEDNVKDLLALMMPTSKDQSLSLDDSMKMNTGMEKANDSLSQCSQGLVAKGTTSRQLMELAQRLRRMEKLKLSK